MDPRRRQVLRQAGLAAVAGLRAALAGPEIIVEEGPPEAARCTAPGGLSVQADAAGDGAPPRTGEPPAPPPTLAVYPAPELSRLAEALGLDGEPLAPDGDPAADASARELAWLPLLAGWAAYRTLPGSRLLAVAGYRRAALVTFGGAGGNEPVWAPLGSDALAAVLGPAGRGLLYLAAPGRLREAIAAGRVRRAVMGGADLAWALALPGAREVRPLTGPGLDWMPVWGLFSRGARLPLPDPPPDVGPHLLIQPAAMAPGLTDWLERAVVT